MKALIVASRGKLEFIETEVPKVGPNDVLVKVAYCGICATDLAILSGETSFVRDGLIKYPVRIGHEWSGVVADVGENVKDIKVGDRVVTDTAVSCGECVCCLKGDYQSCENIKSVGTVNCWDGAFAEYMLMPRRHVFKLPDSLGLMEAALVEPAGIALSGVDKCDLSLDKDVLIIGTGDIGLAAVAIAKSKGARKVFLSGRKAFKLEKGQQMGADAVVNVTNEDLKDFIMKNTEGKGVDVIIETSGNIKVINQCMELVKNSATIVLIGFYET
ncbi:MAG: alcohol dehydrogenase catalytic domain-containing protein [Thermoanaerobacteraceae bacterium]|nr:alcohol dehydrogenase catalytic domain-containing protein [Thermoanaerobacteraceae bacterium]